MKTANRAALFATLCLPIAAIAQVNLQSIQAEHAALQRQYSGRASGLAETVPPATAIDSIAAEVPELSEELRRKLTSVQALREFLGQARLKPNGADAAFPLMALNSSESAGAACRSAILLSQHQAFRVELRAHGESNDTVWLRWHAPAAGTYLLSTHGSDVDARVDRFEDCASITSPAVQVADDEFGLNAELGFDAEYPGQPLYFKLSNLSAGGDAQVVLSASRRISGRIIRESDGAPVANARVSVTLAGQTWFDRVTSTTSDGSYSLYPSTGTADQKYYVRTAGAEYDDSELQQQIWPGRGCIDSWSDQITSCAAGDPIGVDSSGVRSDIDFVLPRGAVLTGRVVDAGSNSSVAGAIVQLFSTATGEAPLRTATADEAGRFRFKGLVPGRYFAIIHASTYASGLFGGALCVTNCVATSGNPIDLGIAGRDDINFALQPNAYFDLSVAVNGAPPSSNSYYSFQVYFANGALVSTQTSYNATTRRFLVGPLAPGTYKIKAKFDSTFAQLSGGVDCASDCEAEFVEGITIQILSSGDRPQVAFDLKRYPSLSGRLTERTTGAPIEGAALYLLSPTGAYTGRRAGTDRDGRYQFEAVPAGSYFVHATKRGFYDRISSDVECESDAPLTFCADATSLNFSLSSSDQILDFGLRRSPELRVTITESGKPLPSNNYWHSHGLRVYRENGERHNQFIFEVNFSTGNVTIFDLPAGKYRVGLAVNGYFTQFVGGDACPRSATSFDPFEGCNANGSRLIEIADHGLDVDLDLTPLGVREARVVRARDGQPLAGVAIDLWDLQGRSLGSVISDVQGRARVKDPSGSLLGTLNVRLSTDNYLGLIDQVYQDIECAVGTSVYKGSCGLAGGTTVKLPELNPAASEIVFRLKSSILTPDVFSSGFE